MPAIGRVRAFGPGVGQPVVAIVLRSPPGGGLWIPRSFAPDLEICLVWGQETLNMLPPRGRLARRKETALDNPILSTLSRPQLEALIVDLSKR